MTYTNRLKLPLLYSGQAQKEVTHNEALNLLDVLVNPVAQEININSPPTDLKIGKLYVIGLEPIGEFTESTIQIPHHSIVIAVNVRIIEEITGAASFSSGTSDDPKRYGSNITSTKDTTNIGLTNHPLTYWSDTSIRITADNSRFTSGTVHITLQILKPHGAWNWE
jgi:hypothetical protein